MTIVGSIIYCSMNDDGSHFRADSPSPKLERNTLYVPKYTATEHSIMKL